MSWKFVFNSSQLIGKTLLQIVNVVHESGYEFFAFNGDVYFYTEGKIHKTKITTKDLY